MYKERTDFPDLAPVESDSAEFVRANRSSARRYHTERLRIPSGEGADNSSRGRR